MSTETRAPSIESHMTLNEIVAHYPQTLEVFQLFGMDTCCGGALPLAEAAAHHNRDLPTLMAALNERIKPEPR
jgi:iron-sulfur cluster repair protein YtfE (RIC family)